MLNIIYLAASTTIYRPFHRNLDLVCCILARQICLCVLLSGGPSAISSRLIFTPTIVKVPNISTIEQWLAFRLVHLIVHMTRPSRRRTPRARLRRKLLDDLLKMRSALSTRIQPGEQVDVALQCIALVFGWLIREACHGRVKKLPGRAAKFSF